MTEKTVRVELTKQELKLLKRAVAEAVDRREMEWNQGLARVAQLQGMLLTMIAEPPVPQVVGRWQRKQKVSVA